MRARLPPPRAAQQLPRVVPQQRVVRQRRLQLQVVVALLLVWLTWTWTKTRCCSAPWRCRWR